MRFRKLTRAIDLTLHPVEREPFAELSGDDEEDCFGVRILHIAGLAVLRLLLLLVFHTCKETLSYKQ